MLPSQWAVSTHQHELHVGFVASLIQTNTKTGEAERVKTSLGSERISYVVYSDSDVEPVFSDHWQDLKSASCSVASLLFVRWPTHHEHV